MCAFVFLDVIRSFLEKVNHASSTIELCDFAEIKFSWGNLGKALSKAVALLILLRFREKKVWICVIFTWMVLESLSRLQSMTIHRNISEVFNRKFRTSILGYPLKSLIQILLIALFFSVLTDDLASSGNQSRAAQNSRNYGREGDLVQFSLSEGEMQPIQMVELFEKQAQIKKETNQLKH